MDEVQTCPVCKNPRKSDGSGSLTQWIITCECDLTALRESAQGLTSSVCARCGKRTREALPGSISQFIFSSDCCSCSLEELQRHVDAGASNALLDGTSSSDSRVLDSEIPNINEFDFDQAGPSVSADGDDQPDAAEASDLNTSAVLSSIQKSILEAANARPAEAKPRVAAALIISGGIVLTSILAIGIGMTGSFHSPEPVATKKSTPPDETLSERMRLYEDEKWTVLAKDGIPFHDGGPDIVDEDFEILNQHKTVRCLRLLRSEKVTGAGLALLKETRIGSMDLNSREFSDEGMKAISRFKTLEILTVGWFYRVTEAGMSYLENLPKLKLLRLSHAKLPVNTLHVVSKIKSLEHFGISISENLRHEDLIELGSLPKLQELRLCADDITDADCIPISRLQHLHSLELVQNKITDKGTVHLAKIPLKNLDLSGNAITDDTLSALSKVKTLKKLVVAKCPGITEKGKTAFHKVLPGCQLLETSNGQW